MDIHEHIPALSGWSSLPAAGFGDFIKMTPLDFWACILSIQSILIDLRPPWWFFWKVGILVKWLCQLDAHRSSVQKTCSFAGGVQSKYDFWCNSWKYRTLARMSTWTINKCSRSTGLIKVHVNTTSGTSPWIFFNLVDPVAKNSLRTY